MSESEKEQNTPLENKNSEAPATSSSDTTGEEQQKNLPDIVTTTEKSGNHHSLAESSPEDKTGHETKSQEEPTENKDANMNLPNEKEGTETKSAETGKEEASKSENQDEKDLTESAKNEDQTTNEKSEKETNETDVKGAETPAIPAEIPADKNAENPPKDEATSTTDVKHELEARNDEGQKTEDEEEEAENEIVDEKDEEYDEEDEAEVEEMSEVEEEELDEDEIKTSPAYIPKHGNFYMHDLRGSNNNKVEIEDSDAKSAPMGRSRADRKWEHDLFDEGRQKPKPTKDLVRRYGRDIRGASRDQNEQESDSEERARLADKRHGRNEPPSKDRRERKNVSREEVPAEGRRRREPLVNPRKQHREPPREERSSYRYQSDTEAATSPPRNTRRSGGPTRGTGYRTVVSSRYSQRRQSPRNALPSEEEGGDSRGSYRGGGNRRDDGYRYPQRQSGEYNSQRGRGSGGPQRFNRSNEQQRAYNRGGSNVNDQFISGGRNEHDVPQGNQRSNAPNYNRGSGGGKRYTAQRHAQAATNKDPGQTRRQNFSNNRVQTNERDQGWDESWDNSPAVEQQVRHHNQHEQENYGWDGGAGYPDNVLSKAPSNFQRGGHRGGANYYQQQHGPPPPSGAYASPMGPPPTGVHRTMPPPPPPPNYSGGAHYAPSYGPRDNYQQPPPPPQHFQQPPPAQQVYPHLRQPTEPVYFDTQQQMQQQQHASQQHYAQPPPPSQPSAMAAHSSGGGGGRPRRQLNIAPPVTHH